MVDSGFDPRAMDNIPEPMPHLNFVMEAFWTLDSERQNGMGIGRIPWSKAMLYAADVLDLHDPEDRSDFWLMIDTVDREYRNYKPEKPAAPPGR